MAITDANTGLVMLTSPFELIETGGSDALTQYNTWCAELGVSANVNHPMFNGISYVDDRGFLIDTSPLKLFGESNHIGLSSEGFLSFYRSFDGTPITPSGQIQVAPPELRPRSIYVQSNAPSFILGFYASQADNGVVSFKGNKSLSGDTILIYINFKYRTSYGCEVTLKLQSGVFELVISGANGNNDKFQVLTFNEGSTTWATVGGNGSQIFDISAATTYRYFAGTPPFSVSGSVTDFITGNIAVGKVFSFLKGSGDKLDVSDISGSGSYSVRSMEDSTSYLVAESDLGLLISEVNIIEPDQNNLFYNKNTTVTPDPTYTSIITGNVSILSEPVKAKLVAVSVEETPRVVGMTESDVITGDYSMDVAPWQDEVLIYRAADYGTAFPPDSVLPVGYVIHPTVPNGFVYRVTTAGITSSVEPEWVTSGYLNSGTATLLTEILHRPIMNGYIKPIVTPI